MKDIELAKYWYYRLKKQWNANNRNDTIHKRIKLLKSYLMKYDYIELGAELPQKDHLILLLRVAKYYGKDYRLYIPQLKSNLFKYLWDTKPDGLRYDEYLKYHEQKSNNSAVISNALKRLHPYAETLRYETILTPLTEGGNQDDKIFIENGKKYKISLKKREHLVPIHLVPDDNIIANSYITYSKYPDSIEIIELKKLFKHLEPAEKEISPLIQDILIDQKISINSVEYNEVKKKLEEITTQTRKIEDLHTEITRLINLVNTKEKQELSDNNKANDISERPQYQKKTDKREKNHGQEGKQPIIDFRKLFPQDIQWTQIEINILDEDSIKIKHPSGSFDVRYSQTQNFVNKTTSKCNNLWGLLLELAQIGSFQPNSSTYKILTKKPGKVKNRVYALGKALMDEFGIIEKPFLPYNSQDGWTPKFTIRDIRKNIYRTNENAEIYKAQQSVKRKRQRQDSTIPIIGNTFSSDDLDSYANEQKDYKDKLDYKDKGFNTVTEDKL